MNDPNKGFEHETVYQEEWLSAYLDEELSQEQRLVVEARLATDPAARGLLEDLKRIRGLVGDLPQWGGSANIAPLTLSDADATSDEFSEEEIEQLDSVSAMIEEADHYEVEDVETSLDLEFDEEDEEDEEFDELADDGDLASLDAGLAAPFEHEHYRASYAWLRPVAMAASLLAMVGIGVFLWPNGPFQTAALSLNEDSTGSQEGSVDGVDQVGAPATGVGAEASESPNTNLPDTRSAMQQDFAAGLAQAADVAESYDRKQELEDLEKAAENYRMKEPEMQSRSMASEMEDEDLPSAALSRKTLEIDSFENMPPSVLNSGSGAELPSVAMQQASPMAGGALGPAGSRAMNSLANNVEMESDAASAPQVESGLATPPQIPPQIQARSAPPQIQARSAIPDVDAMAAEAQRPSPRSRAGNMKSRAAPPNSADNSAAMNSATMDSATIDSAVMNPRAKPSETQGSNQESPLTLPPTQASPDVQARMPDAPKTDGQSLAELQAGSAGANTGADPIVPQQTKPKLGELPAESVDMLPSPSHSLGRGMPTPQTLPPEASQSVPSTGGIAEMESSNSAPDTAASNAAPNSAEAPVETPAEKTRSAISVAIGDSWNESDIPAALKVATRRLGRRLLSTSEAPGSVRADSTVSDAHVVMTSVAPQDLDLALGRIANSSVGLRSSSEQSPWSFDLGSRAANLAGRGARSGEATSVRAASESQIAVGLVAAFVSRQQAQAILELPLSSEGKLSRAWISPVAAQGKPALPGDRVILLISPAE